MKTSNNGGYGPNNTRAQEYRDSFHFGRKRYSISNNSINSYNKNSNKSNMNTDCENSYINICQIKRIVKITIVNTLI